MGLFLDNTAEVPAELIESEVFNAIKGGERRIEVSSDYQHIVSVGRAIKKAVAERIITRKSLFIGLHVAAHLKFVGENSLATFTTQVLNGFLALGVETVDMLTAQRPIEYNQGMLAASMSLCATWQKMVELIKKDKIRFIGILDWKPNHIVKILEIIDSPPQILFLRDDNEPGIKFCQQNGLNYFHFEVIRTENAENEE
ncbi:hypothetical protein CAEBREN_14414 [Caenorhabditis brenneri]|uniref:NADP-dependent oxidoreductase domain-containing protein n=1 Tax=Caenorhabditis brenneri TaxID=135651 RepID=G0N4Z2_CAEBE|nr:hypothetical protein CAEBREN_14414 [Caenorhabditis brenneri]